MTKPGWIDLNSFHLVTLILIQIQQKVLIRNFIDEHTDDEISGGMSANFRLDWRLDDVASLNFIAEMLRIWPYKVSIIFNDFQKKAGKSLIIHLRYSPIYEL